jgi:hypothetical protein
MNTILMKSQLNNPRLIGTIALYALDLLDINAIIIVQKLSVRQGEKYGEFNSEKY